MLINNLNIPFVYQRIEERVQLYGINLLTYAKVFSSIMMFDYIRMKFCILFSVLPPLLLFSFFTSSFFYLYHFKFKAQNGDILSRNLSSEKLRDDKKIIFKNLFCVKFNVTMKLSPSLSLSPLLPLPSLSL